MPEATKNDHPHNEEEELDIDFSDLEAKYATNPDDGLETFVVVDGAPIVPAAKVEVLTKVLLKLFRSVGNIKAEDGFFMPMDEATGKSKGYVFIEYETPQQAQEAVKTYHQKKLDQRHTLLVNKLGDVERYGFAGNVASEYVEPTIEPFKPQEHLKSWLTDSQGRDQMVLHRGDNVGVFYNRKSQTPEQVVDRQHWTEKYVRWSPKGTYLVSIHRQGVALWGGDSWNRLGRFAHNDVRLIDFSPNEKYLISLSMEPISIPPPDSPARAACPFKEQDEGNHVVVWDVKTMLPLRSFPLLPGEGPSAASKNGPPAPEKKIVWPMFKWSSNSKYFARVIPDEALAIYEAPSMGLLDKKSIKIPGIVDFEFAPAPVKLEGHKATAATEDGGVAAGEQILCYWTPEMNNQTARVSIMDVGTRKVIRSRNLFNVSGCRLHWQDQGKYLCVKVDRHTKTKKSTFTNLEFFRLCDKDIPVEVLELKETVINFQWEPKSDRFVLISFLDQGPLATAPVANRNTVAFYAFERSKGSQGTWKPIKVQDKKATNSIYWSPKGRFVIAGTVRPSSACEFEFWDFDHEGDVKAAGAEDLPANLVNIGSCEHYGMTDLEWDPSGRFVVTSSSFWRHAIENGYKMWDFRGSLVREEAIEKFKSFLWRPRPASILPKEKRKQVNKNLKSYSRRFDEEDAMEESEASRQLILKRREALAEWREWRAEMEAHLHELGLTPESDLIAAADGDDDEVIEEIREEILEEKEEEIE
ncbi:Prt1p [Sugiyamaella lignohabitans]|uniref:Eukaryotic translation initiation factor 3 subunit B n=1 Tax=Sugiyamaella lignohabitans TaxID=796027 RepID=A0A167C0N2_9ASCO|nr:Prt1p [Sugiyamaella lignohabitans]ANB11070.1 Prt1p [Sugiyamaella lignohabitans]